MVEWLKYSERVRLQKNCNRNDEQVVCSYVLRDELILMSVLEVVHFGYC